MTTTNLSSSIISLGSDNQSGVHPTILTCIDKYNQGHHPSYGTDPISKEAEKLIKEIFGHQFSAYFVFNGTAANVLALKALVNSYEAVICADHAHLNVDECGAPEQIIGCKLIKLPADNGKITARQIEQALIRKGDQHYSQIKAVSITLPTELGTMYSMDEIEKIKSCCKKHKLFLHIDGARLIYAPHVLSTDFKTICQGVDAVSFGGTKNGLLFGEAVLLANAGDKKETRDFKFIRKQCMQLPSKMRFLGGQFIELLKNRENSPPLYKSIATQGHELALSLRKSLSEIPEVKITRPTEANSVFAILPQSWIKPLRKKFFFYVWDEHNFEVRLMFSFDSKQDHIDGFIDLINEIKDK